MRNDSASPPTPELKKGSLELLVLSVLAHCPRHGYEIGRLTELVSGGHLAFRITTLYPALYRLENRGLIAGRWVERAGERRRCYYRLTEPGQAVLAEQRRQRLGAELSRLAANPNGISRAGGNSGPGPADVQDSLEARRWLVPAWARANGADALSRLLVVAFIVLIASMAGRHNAGLVAELDALVEEATAAGGRSSWSQGFSPVGTSPTALGIFTVRDGGGGR